MLFDYSSVDISNIKSKLLNEYFAIKKDNNNAFLLFQLGDFFEAYFSDAKILADVSGNTIGVRYIKEVGKIAMTGFKKNLLLNYVKLLLAENIKVCVCEQKKSQNGTINREVTRIFTKGTIIEQDFLDSSSNNYILSLNKIDNMFHIAYADISTGQFYKTSGTKDVVILEIEKIAPDEFLLPYSIKNDFVELSDKYNTTIIEDDEYGNIPELIIVNYCKKMQKEFYPEMEEIVEYSPETYLVIDEITRRNLELTRTKRFLKKKGSIIWFLNNTKTSMGMRLLKRYIDEPLVDINEIKKRQDAIQELCENNNLIKDLSYNLSKFNDLSRMCVKISNSTILPKDLYLLAYSVKALEELNLISKNIKTPLINIDSFYLDKVLDFSNKIINSIKEDSPNELKSGGIIKDGYSANLDYLKSALIASEKDLEAYTKKECRKMGFENLEIQYSSAIGYYLEISKTKKTQIPSEYYRKQELSKCIRYSNETINEYETKILHLQYKICELEYELYCDIRKMAQGFVSAIRLLSKSVANIDVLVSLASCALENNFVRPSFNENAIKIKDGFHPSLIKLQNEIIKNDTELKNNCAIVLTGANMSGKSTYLKYNAIISLLSQIGAFVPAKSADVTILDRIFLRQGSTDDIINNNSSFMVEMNDLKFILDNATSHSLVLLDEPAKSTNASEGGAIARAYCEYLIENIKPKMILATHNLELTKMEEVLPEQVFNYVIGRADVSQANVSNRKIKRGVIDSSMAINTAILADLPCEIITEAKKYINLPA